MLTSYLYSSDRFIQAAVIECLITYSGLSLECLDKCMTHLMKQKEKEGADSVTLMNNSKYEADKFVFTLQKVTVLSKAIGRIVKAYNKDFFELSKDYVLNLLNECTEYVSKCTKDFCENSFIIDSGNPTMVFKAVCISNSFYILACLLHMRQKWVNIHLMSILKMWRNFYTECKLALPTTSK